MSNYDSGMFSGNDSDNQQSSDDTQPRHVTKWTLGNHSARPTVDADELKADAQRQRGINDDLADLFEQAAEQAEQASINDYECPACGLAHGHADDKHDIRQSSGLNVRGDFADRMEFNAACHCGVNELAMLMDFYAYIAVPVFTDHDDFAPFTDLSAHRQEVALREMESGAVPEEALIVAGITSPSDELQNALTRLTDRIRDIRNAADGADIADVTENRIETLREDLADDLGVDDDRNDA